MTSVLEKIIANQQASGCFNAEALQLLGMPDPVKKEIPAVETTKQSPASLQKTKTLLEALNMEIEQLVSHTELSSDEEYRHFFVLNRMKRKYEQMLKAGETDSVVEEKLPVSSDPDLAQKVWITLLTLAGLKKKYATREGEWRLLALKSEEWVRSNLKSSFDSWKAAAEKACPDELNPDVIPKELSLVKCGLGNLKCPKGHCLTGLSVKCRPNTFTCAVCKKHDPVSTNPSFYCPLCGYDLCIDCASKALEGKKPATSLDNVVSSGFKVNISGTPCHIGQTGMLYCGKRYASRGQCICGSCDGCCGPNNGCPCPDCYTTFEMVVLSAGLRCSNSHPLTCVAYRTLSKGLKCHSCGMELKDGDAKKAIIGLVCEDCGCGTTFLCARCAFKAAV